jgi:hypothetical protein
LSYFISTPTYLIFIIMKKNEKRSGINKPIISRLISLAIMLALVSPVMLNAQSGKADFSGSWAMNAEKSTFPERQGGGGAPGGGGGRMGGGDIVVSQEANLMTVEQTMNTPNGEMTTTMKYTLDGKESVNESQRGDSKSVATWSSDGKSLKIVTTRSFNMGGQSMDMESAETWSLVNANTLSVERTMSTPNGEMTTTMVYDKK